MAQKRKRVRARRHCAAFDDTILGGCARSGADALQAVHRDLIEERRNRIGCSVNMDSCRAAAEPNANRWDYVLALQSAPMRGVAVEIHHAAAEEVPVVIAKRDWAQGLLAAQCPAFEVLRWVWLIPAGSQALFLRNSPAARALAEAGFWFPAPDLVL